MKATLSNMTAAINEMAEADFTNSTGITLEDVGIDRSCE